MTRLSLEDIRTLKPDSIIDHEIEVASDPDAFVRAGELAPSCSGESVQVALGDDLVPATEIEEGSRRILRVEREEEARKLETAQTEARKGVRP